MMPYAYVPYLILATARKLPFLVLDVCGAVAYFATRRDAERFILQERKLA